MSYLIITTSAGLPYGQAPIHDTWFQIEPSSGKAILRRYRHQVNVYVDQMPVTGGVAGETDGHASAGAPSGRQLQGGGGGGLFPEVSPLYFPLMWVDGAGVASSAWISDFKTNVQQPATAAGIIEIACASIAGLCALSAFVLFFVGRSRGKKYAVAQWQTGLGDLMVTMADGATTSNSSSGGKKRPSTRSSKRTTRITVKDADDGASTSSRGGDLSTRLRAAVSGAATDYSAPLLLSIQQHDGSGGGMSMHDNGSINASHQNSINCSATDGSGARRMMLPSWFSAYRLLAGPQGAGSAPSANSVVNRPNRGSSSASSASSSTAGSSSPGDRSYSGASRGSSNRSLTGAQHQQEAASSPQQQQQEAQRSRSSELLRHLDRDLRAIFGGAPSRAAAHVMAVATEKGNAPVVESAGGHSNAVPLLPRPTTAGLQQQLRSPAGSRHALAPGARSSAGKAAR